MKNTQDVKDKDNKKIKKKKKHKVLKAFLIILLAIVLFIGGFLGYSAFKNGWGLRGVLQTLTGQSEEKLKDLDEFRVLLLGYSEDISVKLTDTIMVASYNPRTQKATLLSIPRDTFIGTSQYSANSYDKINALYQSGGAKKTLEAVNEITGLDIKYYVAISNNALVDLVNEIGGVEFDVPIDMNYTDKKQGLYINLKKGVQKLNGEQAEGLVRFRHNSDKSSYPEEYGDQDYGRMKTQRNFIKAVAKQTLQLKNIAKIGSFIDIFKKNVDTNIKDWSTIKDYIPYAVEFDTENLNAEAIPGESRRIPANTGLYFFIYDEIETEKLVEELFVEEEEENTESQVEQQNNSKDNNSTTEDKLSTSNNDVKIELLNGSGDSALLTKATDKLKEKGYTVYKTGTTSKTSRTTIVNNSGVDDSIVNNIKKDLKKGVISNSSSSTTVDITVILGLDYKG